MNNQELQQLTCSISINYFKTPFEHEATFNNRLRTTGGRYLLNTHNIEINPKQYQTFGYETLVDIIKHELCHYHLHLEGKGHYHKDQDFKQLSKRVGASRYCKPIINYEDRANYVYMCTKCKTKFKRIKKINLNKFVCGKCKGRIKLIDKLN